MGEQYSSLKLDKIYEKIGSSEKGLSSTEARERLKKYGANELASKDKTNTFSIFISQFKSPIVLILIAASIIAGFLGESIDSIVILGIVFVDSLLGFYQEYKSEKVLEELKKYVRFSAKF